MTQIPKLNLKWLGLFLGFSFVFGLNQVTGWQLLQLWNIKGNVIFQDLNTILLNVDCYQAIGWAVYESKVGNGCNNYVYGSVLIRFWDFFGFNSSQEQILGWIAIFLISFALANLIAKIDESNRKIFHIGLLAVFSPPVFLLVERGNLDWLVFFLIYLASISFAKKITYLGFLFLALSALLKFYTFPLLFVIFFLVRRRTDQLLYGFVILAVFVQILFDLSRLKSIYIGGWSAAFGNTVWSQYLDRLGFGVNIYLSATIGICITICLGAIVLRLNPLTSSGLTWAEPLRTMDYFAILSSLTFLGCYFAGLNHDYRLIFMIPILWFFTKGYGFAWGGTFFVLFPPAFWFSFNAKLFQPIGDLAINILVIYLVMGYAREFKSQIGFKSSKAQNVT